MSSLLLLKSLLIANSLHSNKKKRKKIVKDKVSTVSSSKVKPKIANDMCRICNQEKGDIPIFGNSTQPYLSQDIQHFSGIMIKNSDGLSTVMCKNCMSLLNGCILFREMCRTTNRKIIECLIKKEKPNINYDEQIEDYTAIDEMETSDYTCNFDSPTFSNKYQEICCTRCDKEFCDMPTYNEHKCSNKQNINEQSEEFKKKKFLCDVCGKTASSNASLLVHMTTHENIFPFKCEICPYQGRTMDLLKVHKRSHLKEAEKPYKCTQCPKATTSASNLQKHMRHVHSVNRPYKCTYCEKAFPFQHDMKRHIRDIHLRQGTVECNICFKKFNTKKILRGHQLKVHKIKGDRQGRLPSYLQCQTVGQDHGDALPNDDEFIN